MPSLSLFRQSLLVFAATVALQTGALGQAAVDPPDELANFWTRWTEAKATNQDEESDKVVRRFGDEARMMLNTLLDDISRKENQELHFEIRLLAWSMDRVQRTERFIHRVRTVIEMDMRRRGLRAIAMTAYERGWEGIEAARIERSEAAWEKPAADLRLAEKGFAEVGDLEFRILALQALVQLERERLRYWDEAQLHKQILELAAQLPFDDGDAQLSQDGLTVVRQRGVDPDGPRPEGGVSPPVSDQGTPGGTSVDSFAPGSEWQEFRLDFVAPKKAPANIVPLPGFGPWDQYQLWQQTYIEEEGPVDFDFLRGGRFKPGGKGWTLRRSGIEMFEIDTDGDGKAEASFPASGSPQRVEVPVDGVIWPIQVCTFDQREQMFDFQFNYAPVAAGARLRFWLGSWWEGQVLGEVWKVYDCDLDGGFGVAYENFDDLVTLYSDDDHVTWHETDGVQIGKARTAVPFSKVMRIGGAFHRVEADGRKGTVRTRELNLATGLLQVDLDLKTEPACLVVRALDDLEGAYFDILPERKGQPVSLPVGNYQISLGRVAKGSKNSMDQVRIYSGRSQPFQITAGATTKLELGAPFSLTFSTRKENDEILIDSRTLRCFGRGGEEYAMFFDDPLQPELAMRDGNGRKIGKPTRMRRVSVGEWQSNTGADNILWFPFEERVPAPSQGFLEFQMTQKSHALLGGPFESQWIR